MKRWPKKSLNGYIVGRRPVGSPRERWSDAVDSVEIRELQENGDTCGRSFEEAKALVGL